MRFRMAHIKNYKSFRSSDEIIFTPGVNVIVGRNNSGKTALAEMLSFKENYELHRSIETLPNRDTPILIPSQPEMEFEIELSKSSFIRLSRDSYFEVRKGSSSSTIINRLMKLLENETIIIHFLFKITPNNTSNTSLGYFPIVGQPEVRDSVALKIEGNELRLAGRGIRPQDTRDITEIALQKFKQSVYMFDAERFNIGSSGIEMQHELLSNASNLPTVLHYLRTQKPALFDRYLATVQQILPEIKYVTLPVKSGSATIIVHHVEPNKEREDLGIPLTQSGTGISQILAILAVIVTAYEPKVIIIDEPQTFLHPGAIRKLFSILKQQPIEHQYIITTHSPDAILSANPQNIIQVEKVIFESRAKSIDLDNALDLRTFMLDIGVSLSDVFGADNILWVEGTTEASSFPLIIEQLLQRPLMGTSILSVLHTGDFERKRNSRGLDPKMVFELYERLSHAGSIIPPAIGYVFDRENRTEQQMADLVRQGKQGNQEKSRVYFLNRRLYENYLLNPSAIAHVMAVDAGFNGVEINPDAIVAWIAENVRQKRYFHPLPVPKEKELDSLYLDQVHGANLLEDIFSYFSENRAEYNKVKHGAELTDWLIKHAPEDLDDIVELLRTVFNASPTE